MNLLITGISSDIGIALTKKLSLNYDKIYGQYRTINAELEVLSSQLGDKLCLLQCDLKNEDETILTANSLQQTEIDHFIHLPASSLSFNTRFLKTGWSMFEEDIDISLRSAVLFSQAAISGMAKRKYGKIIYMLSSYCVDRPAAPYLSAYLTVKSGLLGLMKALSSEYASKFISVNAVSPSMFETKFLNNISNLIIEKNAKESPIGRNLTVGDIVPTFEFLLSKGADCITGQNIAVTAGN